MVCNSKNKLGISIDIVIDNRNISVELNNSLFIKEIDKNENTHLINASVCIDLNANIHKTYWRRLCKL